MTTGYKWYDASLRRREIGRDEAIESWLDWQWPRASTCHALLVLWGGPVSESMMICHRPSRCKVHVHSDCSLPIASLLRPSDSKPRIPTATQPVTTSGLDCLSWKGRSAFAALDCGLPCTFPLEFSLAATRPLAPTGACRAQTQSTEAKPACGTGRPPNPQGPDSPCPDPS